MFRLSAIAGFRLWACLALIAYAGAVNHEALLVSAHQVACHEHGHEDEHGDHEDAPEHDHHDHDCALCASITIGELTASIDAAEPVADFNYAPAQPATIRTADVHSLLPDLRGPPVVVV